MSARATLQVARLLERLLSHPQAHLVRLGGDVFALAMEGRPGNQRVAGPAARALLTSGLLAEVEPGRLVATQASVAWLRRTAQPEIAWRAQHDEIDAAGADEADGGALVNRNESPVAALARRAGRNGEPWLADHAVAAAERLRRDFEVGQLQPRITANWSASVASGRRADGGVADLTDMALGARVRFEAAIAAVGPELSGLLLDICCFLKGLELVERERQWPARSAKLVLRIGLQGLARHYGLTGTASGHAASGGIRHWGDDDYRPRIN